MSFKVEKIKESRINDVNFDDLSFGIEFSDHMLISNFSDGEWSNPIIKPYGPISYKPAMSILHYGQGVFEGMKAFRQHDDSIIIFRPEAHYNRFIKSCRRVVIPEIPKSIFMEGLKQIIDLDKNWVPKEKYKSLYLRPFVVATDEFLGLRPSANYSFMIITSPVGNYYKEGIKPVNLSTRPDYTRAVKGGVGNAKVPGNYAASLQPTKEAASEGFTQVLWLEAGDTEKIEEVGTSNIFFVVNGTLLTPPLSGSILPGITRDSVITLARKLGFTVEERACTITEVAEWAKNGNLTEIFATGTAAVVSPVGSIHHKGEMITLDKEKMGPIAQQLYDTLTQIHHGEYQDEFGWCEKV